MRPTPFLLALFIASNLTTHPSSTTQFNVLISFTNSNSKQQRQKKSRCVDSLELLKRAARL